MTPTGSLQSQSEPRGTTRLRFSFRSYQSSLLRGAAGTDAERENAESHEGRHGANPGPRRVVRHERAEDEPRTLEGPHRARKGDKDSENDQDDAHGLRTRGTRIRLSLSRQFALKRQPTPGPLRGNQPPVITRFSCACQLR